MTITRKELATYLLREQGYEKEVVRNMSIAEMMDLYEMYHED